MTDQTTTKSTVIKTDNNPNHKLIEETTVQQNIQMKKGFFNKRNIVITVVAFAVAIVLLGLSFKFALDINFNALFGSISNGFTMNLGALWFILLFVMMITTIGINYFGIWLRVHSLGIKIPKYQYFLFTLTVAFLKATTPANLVYDPYTIFWLKSQGISTSRATSIMFSTTFWWQITHISITFPSFVMAMVHFNELLHPVVGTYAQPWIGYFIVSSIILGFIFDFIGMGFTTLLCLSKQFHYVLSRIFNWVKKKFHRPYHTKEQIIEKYKTRAVIKNDFLNDCKDWKTCLFTCLAFGTADLLVFISIGWAMSFVAQPGVSFNFLDAYNCCNMTFTANKMAFLFPGAEFFCQWFLKNMLQAIGGLPISDASKTLVDNSIVIWRSFNIYFPAILGLAGIIAVVVLQVRKSINKKAIIVGCGISGATVANVLANSGWQVTILEKNGYIGGNCYDSKNEKGILIHNFGPHIFHTNDEDVYQFVSRFAKLNTYKNQVLVSTDNKLIPLPINFKSIEIVMGDRAPRMISILKREFPDRKTITLFELKKIKDNDVEEFVDWISKNVYFNYSAKMWGTKFENIDPSTINRVKIVLGYEHNYFPEDKYQGLPIGGYTMMINKMIQHPNIRLNLNVNGLDHLVFDNNNIKLDGKRIKGIVIYCGPLDELLNYRFGVLPYRSLNIKFKTLEKASFQETAVINYPAHPTMTRIAEYKKMTLQTNPQFTTISEEYPGQFDANSKEFNVRYYPIINQDNQNMYNKYASYFKQFKNFYPLGRLSQYKYYDMDDAIKQSLALAKEITHA